MFVLIVFFLFQITSSSKVEFLIIEGCFEGLWGFLHSFPLNEALEAGTCQRISGYLKSVLKVKDVWRKTASRGEIFLSSHCLTLLKYYPVLSFCSDFHIHMLTVFIKFLYFSLHFYIINSLNSLGPLINHVVRLEREKGNHSSCMGPLTSLFPVAIVYFC